MMNRTAVGAALFVLASLAARATPATAEPAVRTWDGGGVDNKWTTAANWVGDTVPGPGDILAFPNTASVKAAVNDFPVDTAFTALRIVTGGTGVSDYTLSGNRVTVTDDITVELYGNVIELPLRLGDDVVVSSDGGLALAGGVELNGHQLVLAGSGTVNVTGITGTGDADAAVVVAMDETGSAGASGSDHSFTGDTVVVSGSFSVNVPNWPGSVFVDGGTFGVGENTISGDVVGLPGGGRMVFGSTRIGSLDLDPATVFVGPASVWVEGTVALNDAELELGTQWCGPCSWGRNTELVFNDGSDAVVGTFAGLADGARWQEGNVFFEIDYTAGDGNDVYVRVVDSLNPGPPPLYSPPPYVPPPPPPPPSGYWMVGASGDVYAFGDARWFGSARSSRLVVDIEPTRNRDGYWVVNEFGTVFPVGNAPRLSSSPSLGVGERVTALSATGSGNGYWLFTNKGRVITYGDAVHRGDMAGRPLNGPVLDAIPTASGGGYFMVASDGGIFAFGDAVFRGSMGGKPLNKPVESLVPDGDNDGYWLVASDGGVFAFNADFRGSMGGKPLNKPVTGMVRYGNGYLMVGEDGGIFNFSDQPFRGSLGNNPPAVPIVNVAGL